jgi:hypothetical protein
MLSFFVLIAHAKHSIDSSRTKASTLILVAPALPNIRGSPPYGRSPFEASAASRS